MSRVTDKQRWNGLISDICSELVKINKLPEKTLEDIWVESTLNQVLRKMCALHKMPPKMQKCVKPTRILFED